MTPRCPICFLKQGPSAALHMHVGLGGTLVRSCHVPSIHTQHKTPSAPPRPRSTCLCSTRMYTHVSWPSKRRELFTGGNSSREGSRIGGGVWKPIFPPQKPQSRQDQALNPQGLLGGTQRYTQLARSPPWENRSRCPPSLTPWPLPCQGCLGDQGWKPLKRTSRPRGTRCQDHTIPRETSGHIARGFPRSSPTPAWAPPIGPPRVLPGSGATAKTQDPSMAPSSISK